MTKGIVLVVDDDKATVDIVDLALREQGYRVVTAAGRQSLPAAHYLQPDVILMDINMPEMNGVQVSERLRADPATSRIPIVAMSSLPRIKEATPRMLFDDRLPKPFTLARLLDTVARWVSPA